MSDCCTPRSQPPDSSADCAAGPKKLACPVDGNLCTAVEHRTLLQHLIAPWRHTLSSHQYYFCDNANCPVVYFDTEQHVIGLDDLRGPIGQKQSNRERLLCYCFGVTLAQAETDPAAKRFVIEQTKQGSCSCETRNPSGRCCLKDFPK